VSDGCLTPRKTGRLTVGRNITLTLTLPSPCRIELEFVHPSPVGRRRRWKGNPVPGVITRPSCSWVILIREFCSQGWGSRIGQSQMCSWVPRDSDARITALAGTGTNCKLLNRPIVKRRPTSAMRQVSDSNENLLLSPRWRFTPRQTDRPSVVTYVWLRLRHMAAELEKQREWLERSGVAELVESGRVWRKTEILSEWLQQFFNFCLRIRCSQCLFPDRYLVAENIYTKLRGWAVTNWGSECK
jgi:hypothetical protein